MEYGQIDRFLRDGSNENRYILVRKVVAIVAIAGGQKAHDLRGLSMSNIRPLPEGTGYRVTHPPCQKSKRTKEIR